MCEKFPSRDLSLSLTDSQYANLLTTSSKDLHTLTSTSQIPVDQEQGENNVSRPRCLPDYNTVYKPFTINWGKRGYGSAIGIPTSIITDAYNEIETWRKNVFRRDFRTAPYINYAYSLCSKGTIGITMVCRWDYFALFLSVFIFSF